VTARQHHREAVDPRSRCAVLESSRTSGVRRDDAAREGAHERRCRRVPTAARTQVRLECFERDTSADANVSRTGIRDLNQTIGRKQQATRGCRASGHRRLRPDRQHALRAEQQGGDLAFGARPGDSVGLSTGKVRRILKVGGDGFLAAKNLGLLISWTWFARFDDVRHEPDRLRRCASSTNPVISALMPTPTMVIAHAGLSNH